MGGKGTGHYPAYIWHYILWRAKRQDDRNNTTHCGDEDEACDSSAIPFHTFFSFIDRKNIYGWIFLMSAWQPGKWNPSNTWFISTRETHSQCSWDCTRTLLSVNWWKWKDKKRKKKCRCHTKRRVGTLFAWCSPYSLCGEVARSKMGCVVVMRKGS